MHGGYRAHNCTAWLPALPDLPAGVVWTNLVLYALLFALALVLCLRSCDRRQGVQRSAQQLLVMLFVSDRVVWASLLVKVMMRCPVGKHHPFSASEQRFAFVTNRLGCVLFFCLTGLLLTDIADALVVGWKSSRRLWCLFGLVAALLGAAALALMLGAPGIHGLMHPSDSVLSLSDDITCVASGAAALIILGIALRYWRMPPPAVLVRFSHVRMAINGVGLLAFACFAFRCVRGGWLRPRRFQLACTRARTWPAKSIAWLRP